MVAGFECGILLAFASTVPAVGAHQTAYCSPAVFDGSAPPPFGGGSGALTCAPLELTASGQRIHLAVAANDQDRERGLMHVRRLPRDAGMLFVFGVDGERYFWMKDTLISLDMVFVDRHGKITSIAPNVAASEPALPDDLVERREGFGAYVIELGAGVAQRFGLHTGKRLSFPAIHADP